MVRPTIGCSTGAALVTETVNVSPTVLIPSVAVTRTSNCPVNPLVFIAGGSIVN